jgi:hypothetical protein
VGARGTGSAARAGSAAGSGADVVTTSSRPSVSDASGAEAHAAAVAPGVRAPPPTSR